MFSNRFLMCQYLCHPIVQSRVFQTTTVSSSRCGAISLTELIITPSLSHPGLFATSMKSPAEHAMSLRKRRPCRISTQCSRPLPVRNETRPEPTKPAKAAGCDNGRSPQKQRDRCTAQDDNNVRHLGTKSTVARKLA